MNENKALVIIKPDAFERNLSNTILMNFLNLFKLVEIKTAIPEQDQWEQHYEEHQGKPFYDGLIQAMVNKKVIIAVFEHEAIDFYDENLMGVIREEAEGIRDLFVDTAYIGPRNLVHCSDSPEAATKEIELWFGESKTSKTKEVTAKKTKSNKRKSFELSAVGVENLLEQVNEYLDNLPIDSKVTKDLSKVQFDWENSNHYPSEGTLLGPQELTIEEKAFSFYGVQAGGDWEWPVFFILYLDDKKKLRGYVPKDGNPWNYNTKEAFGNDEDEDLKFYKKHVDCDEEDMPEYFDVCDADQFYDVEKMEKEIINRFELV